MDAVSKGLHRCLNLIKESLSGAPLPTLPQDALKELADELKAEASRRREKISAMEVELARLQARYSRLETALEKAQQLGEEQIQADIRQTQEKLNTIIPVAVAEERRVQLFGLVQDLEKEQTRLEDVRQNIITYQDNLAVIDLEQKRLKERESELISGQHRRKPLETILELRAATLQMADQVDELEGQLAGLVEEL